MSEAKVFLIVAAAAIATFAGQETTSSASPCRSASTTCAAARCASIEITGKGFLGGETVHGTLHSDPVDLGTEVVAETPEHFAALIKSELVKWSKLIKQAGIRLE